MSFRRASNLVAFLSLATVTTTAAVEAPLPVSPGEVERFAPVTSACPAFSWTEADGAAGYELAVYEARGGELSPAPALQVELPAGALGWTPSADRCLPPGSRYAWLVRPISDEGPGSWSSPRLFSVPAAPSSEEVTRAMEVLERHLAATAREGPRSAPEEAGARAPRDAEPDGNAGTPAGSGVLDLLEGASLEEKEAPTGTAAMKGRLPDTGGEVYGLWGETASTEGTGVLGWATPTTGGTVGVLGQSESTEGFGVVGFAPASTGTSFGIGGISSSPDGAGVVAFNLGGGPDLVLENLFGPATALTESGLTVDSSNDRFFDFANVGTGTLNLRLDGSPLLTEATGGDITSVEAGAGLTGGGTSGDVSVAIAEAGVTGTMIEDGGVGGADIAVDAVTSVHIGAGHVTSIEIQDGEVGEADLAGGAVTSSKIKNGGVKTFDLADDAVTDTKIATDAVTGGKVLDGSIGFVDIGTNGCVDEEIMKWNGSAWTCADDVTPSLFGVFGGDGRDGARTVSSTESLGAVSRQYTDLVVESTGSLNVDQEGWAFIGVQGTCEIRGKIVATGAGAPGGEGLEGSSESEDGFDATGVRRSRVPVVPAASGAGGAGGTSGTACSGGFAPAPGAGGGAAGWGGLEGPVASENQAGGPPAIPLDVIAGDIRPLTLTDNFGELLYYRGAGGGGGGCSHEVDACSSGSVGSGGAGGGVVYLECGRFVFGETIIDAGSAEIRADGANGELSRCSSTSECCEARGAGGGGGGVVVVRTKESALNSGNIDVSGGAGGEGNEEGHPGASGFWAIVEVP